MSSTRAHRWRFFIDRGGTFTDCIGYDSDAATMHVAKVLSGPLSPVVGIRQLLGLEADAPIEPCEVRMGTTVCTNALLERKGHAGVLVITRGFADLLELGDQTRPELFDLEIRKPSPLHGHVIEVDSRAAADGSVIARTDLSLLKAELAALVAQGVRSAAIVVMHGYACPELERELADAVYAAGIEHVSLSHEVASELGMLARGDTTMVDAYLAPVLARYLNQLREHLPGSDIRMMQSSGDLADVAQFRARDAILSGPAGGVVAYAHIAQRLGLSPVIGFDMGGTSTDVSRWDGDIERVHQTTVAGVRMRVPMMGIHTVAAGGGSICRYDTQRFVVGPESAGADPGPLCYGRPHAEALTLTDINLALGRVHVDQFPFRLHVERVEAALDALVDRLDPEARMALFGQPDMPMSSSARAHARRCVAQGFFRVAIDNMADAIRRITIAKGHDAREHALIVFGGASGQHACHVAAALDIDTVVFPPLGGVLSAVGMGVARLGWHGQRDAGRIELSARALETLEAEFRHLEQTGGQALVAQGQAAADVIVQRSVDLRYVGTENVHTLTFAPADELAEAFHTVCGREFGYRRDQQAIEIVTVRVRVHSTSAPLPLIETSARESSPHMRFVPLANAASQLVDVPAYHRHELAPGTRIDGPSIVFETTGTIVVDAGWSVTVAPDGSLRGVRERVDTTTASTQRDREDATAIDPVRLEVFGNRFMSIAEQMGAVLARTAISTNIRERRDFSCAVFDGHGNLVANAPHIPVHLGAMAESVQAVIQIHPTMLPGDAYVTNDPALGGSHLPDITVVNPVHNEHGQVLFFVASRGHHADIGGSTPGSMPPFSSTLAEEGVVLRALPLVQNGRFDHEGILAALRGDPQHPEWAARNPNENVADLRAQVAANHTGARLLSELVATQGEPVVQAYMQHCQRNAALRVRAAIGRLPRGTHRFVDALDDGTPIAVSITVTEDRMRIDFGGTAAESNTNLNAPRAVTTAAVLYVLRSLVGQPIPLNSGCLEPIDLVIPEASLLSPSPGRAVVAGNVETSQRVVDVLLGALGVAAASQGTMNNLSFGTDSWGYYETLAGGSGAGLRHLDDGSVHRFAGAHGVHTHMTNTKITDPEVLEARFPLRLRTFARRRGSGGGGRWPGGDGVIREIEFLAPVSLSILSERRRRAPFGLDGGEPGAMGCNRLWQNGEWIELGGKAHVSMQPGDRIRIETPGGGGLGARTDPSTPITED